MDFQYQVQAPGPALARLLARITADGLLPPPTGALSARLSQWIDWSQAVALSAALATPASPLKGREGPAEDEPDACDEVRGAILASIERDRAFVGGHESGRAPEAAFYRQRYVGLQQVMAAEVGLLRRRLRERLGQQPGALPRLAALDGVMEKAVGEHEHLALSVIPDQLVTHFERLRLSDPAHGLVRFQQDMKRLLLAELDVRLQPARGLLATLRTASDRHAP